MRYESLPATGNENGIIWCDSKIPELQKAQQISILGYLLVDWSIALQISVSHTNIVAILTNAVLLIRVPMTSATLIKETT